jgi:hypothetical protein
MRLVRIAAIVIIMMIAAFALVTAPPALSAPLADGTLNNPGFESGFTKSTVEPDWTNVPNGWTPWYSEGGSNECGAGNPQPYKKPHIEDERDTVNGLVKEGGAAARLWQGYGIMNAGLYQTVAVTAGTTYQFSAYAFLWAITKQEDATVGHESDSNMSFQVGIDPGGGTNGTAGTVKWSGGSQTMDAYTQQSVSATATGGTITVFLRATAYWCGARNDARIDGTSLVATGTGPAPGATAVPGQPAKTATPKPGGTWGAAAGSIVTATPGPDGSIVHTVGPGETCVGIATAYNIGLDTLEKQNGLTNATCKFISVGLKLTIKGPGGGGGGTTDGGGEGGGGAEQTEAPTEPPTVAPTEIAEVQTGTICVLGYEDADGSGLREPIEAKLPGMTFTVTDSTGAPVVNYTTTGNEPYCFAQLAAGNYTVRWEGDGLNPVGDQAWQVTVTAGSSANREFGATTGAAPENPEDPQNPNTSSEGLPTWAIALIGAFGVILFMGGLGVAGYFLLLRRTNI